MITTSTVHGFVFTLGVVRQVYQSSWVVVVRLGTVSFVTKSFNGEEAREKQRVTRRMLFKILPRNLMPMRMRMIKYFGFISPNSAMEFIYRIDFVCKTILDVNRFSFS